MDSVWRTFAGHGVKEHFVDAAGTRTRVIEAGNGPTVILLHGTGGHAESFTKNIVPISNIGRSMAIDMIGHGYTDRPDVVYTLDLYVDHLLAVMDACEIDTAFVSGESLGGGVACWAAIKHPARIRGLILASGILARPDAKGSKDLDDVEARTRKLADDFSRETIRRRLEWLVLDKTKMTEEMVDIRYDIYSQPGMVDHMIEVMVTSFAMNRSAVGDIDYYGHDLSAIKCPVLTMWSDHNPGKSYQSIQHAIDAIPHNDFHLIKDAGHWPQWEQADECNALIMAYLRRNT